jgi:hypothetical protein
LKVLIISNPMVKSEFDLDNQFGRYGYFFIQSSFARNPEHMSALHGAVLVVWLYMGQ